MVSWFSFISVPWCVQESAVTVIFMLMPFDEEFALNSLKSWLPLNEKNVSQSLRELLRMKELLRT